MSENLKKTLVIQLFKDLFPWAMANATRRYVSVFAFTVGILHSGGTWALNFPDAPLLSQTIVQPNVMLLMDTSGSMSGVVVEGYDQGSAAYDVCDPANLRPDGLPVTGIAGEQVIVASSLGGVAYFTAEIYDENNNLISSQDYQWGNSTSTPVLNTVDFPLACFDGTVDNNTQLRLPSLTGGSSNIPFWGGEPRLNFLNFYLSNTTQTGPDTTWLDDGGLDLGYKPGTSFRIDIAKRAAEAFIPTLTGVNLGVASFITDTTSVDNNTDPNIDTSQYTGAKIDVEIQPIDSVVDGQLQRDRIIDAVANYGASGFTPLGEAFSDIARYYITGYEDVPLTLYPDSENPPEPLAGAEIFSGVPMYGPDAAVPTESSEVITESCQASYIIAFTDGQPVERGLVSEHLMGSSDNSYAGYDPDGVQNGLDQNGYAVGVLDDVVLALNDIDLRPTPGNAFASEKNNITSFFVGGFDANLANEGSILDNAANNGAAGTGLDFGVIPAANEATLIQAFETLFTAARAEAFSQTAVAFNSGSIGNDSALFQATYQTQGPRWSGNLFAFDFLDSVNDEGEIIDSTPLWNASVKLNSRVTEIGPSDRNIITFGTNGDGVAFTQSSLTNGLIHSSIVDDIDGSTNDQAVAIDVLEYLRGDESFDPVVFRQRIPESSSESDDLPPFSVLGDIVNSSPIEVGPPEIGYPDQAPFGQVDENTIDPYSKFADDNAARKSVIYVGANDGMVHAFDGDVSLGGDGGEELFAYLPSLVADGSSDLEGLFYLTDPNYTHRFYVDGELTASDVFIKTTGGGAQKWRLGDEDRGARLPGEGGLRSL